MFRCSCNVDRNVIFNICQPNKEHNYFFPSQVRLKNIAYVTHTILFNYQISYLTLKTTGPKHFFLCKQLLSYKRVHLCRIIIIVSSMSRDAVISNIIIGVIILKERSFLTVFVETSQYCVF